MQQSTSNLKQVSCTRPFEIRIFIILIILRRCPPIRNRMFRICLYPASYMPVHSNWHACPTKLPQLFPGFAERGTVEACSLHPSWQHACTKVCYIYMPKCHPCAGAMRHCSMQAQKCVIHVPASVILVLGPC